LVNHFQGRTTCPYGQSDAQARDTSAPEELVCHVPGTSDRVSVAVSKQFSGRRSQDTVYCSCQCAGPDPNGVYCACPGGFQCVSFVGEYSYCIKAGTEYEAGAPNVGLPCTLSQTNPPTGDCGNPDGT
jgi:hypothetical protein